MENELAGDFLTAIKQQLEVSRLQQHQLECLHKVQTSMFEMLNCIVQAVDEPAPDVPRLGIDVAAMQRARAEILELEKLFNDETEPKS